MAGHGSQKLFGWFRGAGPTGSGAVFEQFGIRPGRKLATFAGTCELIGSALIMFGLAFPLGNAILIASMTVAVVVTFGAGLWSHPGPGYEVALIYGAMSVGLSFTGPGRWSLDATLGFTAHNGYLWGCIAVLVGFSAAAPVLVRRRFLLSANRRRTAVRT